MADEPRLSDNERAMLKGMRYGTGSEGEEWCLTFKGIADRCEVPPHLIRRTVRALARKGLTSFHSGLFTEDGEVAGAGYTLTQAGRALAWKLYPRASVKQERLEGWA